MAVNRHGAFCLTNLNSQEMCALTKNVRWNKVIISGFVYLIISTIIHQVEVLLTMDYFKLPTYFGLWSKLMMPKAGPPPLKFYLFSFLFSLIAGLAIALLYEIIKDRVAKESAWKKTVSFTCLLVLLSGVFFSLPVYLLLNIPLGLLAIWFLSAVVIFAISSAAFVRIMK